MTHPAFEVCLTKHIALYGGAARGEFVCVTPRGTVQYMAPADTLSKSSFPGLLKRPPRVLEYVAQVLSVDRWKTEPIAHESRDVLGADCRLYTVHVCFREDTGPVDRWDAARGLAYPMIIFATRASLAETSHPLGTLITMEEARAAMEDAPRQGPAHEAILHVFRQSIAEDDAASIDAFWEHPLREHMLEDKSIVAYLARQIGFVVFVGKRSCLRGEVRAWARENNLY